MTRRSFFRFLPAAPLALLATPAPAAAAMTLAKMQAVTQAITNAGYEAHEFPNSDGTWRVRAKSPNLDIPVVSAANLASAQGVNGFISEIEYA